MTEQERKELAYLVASPCEMYCYQEDSTRPPCCEGKTCDTCGTALEAVDAVIAAGYRKTSSVVVEMLEYIEELFASLKETTEKQRYNALVVGDKNRAREASFMSEVYTTVRCFILNEIKRKYLKGAHHETDRPRQD